MKTCKVAVIGAGVVGLSSAVEIQRKFGKRAEITIFTSDVSPNTTGDVSAGLWGPYLLQDTPMSDIIKWSKITLDYMHHLWKTGKAEQTGISLVPLIMLTDDPSCANIPEWSHIAFGMTEINPKYLKNFGEEHNVKYRSGFTFVSFTCEPTKFLPFLQKEFTAGGGSLIFKTITNFEQLAGFDVIVNCCGLSAKDLVQDNNVQPIRGQIARVEAPWQFHGLFDEHNYIIPNMECVILGGTHQIADYDMEPRKEDTEKVVGGCYKLQPSLKKGIVMKHQVGLRPGRTQVRIALETRTIGGKPTFVVHNYGHGGSGVTMCTGCAIDACDLVQKALNTKLSKL